MDQVVPAGREFRRRRLDIRNFELDGGLGDRYVIGPFASPETRLRGVGQRPDTKMFRPFEPVDGDVVALYRLEEQFQRFLVEGYDRRSGLELSEKIRPRRGSPQPSS